MILLIKTKEKNHVIKKAEAYLEEKGFLDHVKAKMIPFEISCNVMHTQVVIYVKEETKEC